MNLYIDFSPLDLGIRVLGAGARARLPAELEIAAIEGMLLLQGELMQALPKGAGGVGGGSGLAASVSYGVERTASGAVGEIGSPLEYAEHVEFGTRPHFPPIQPLQDWVEVKLGLRGAEARSVAHAIAVTIGRRGTAAQPVWEPTFTRCQPMLRAKVNAAIDRAVEALP